MSDDLPARIEPFSLAEDGVSLAGELPVDSLPRLRDMAIPGGRLRADLRFGRGEDGRPELSGEFSVTLRLVCQRCLEPMELPLQGEIRLTLVHDLAEADRLTDRCEVLQVDDRAMPLAAILEDEVLLAVPTIPLHPPEQCSVAPTAQDYQDEEFEASKPERPNPFAVLASLKKDPEPDPESGPH